MKSNSLITRSQTFERVGLQSQIHYSLSKFFGQFGIQLARKNKLYLHSKSTYFIESNKANFVPNQQAGLKLICYRTKFPIQSVCQPLYFHNGKLDTKDLILSAILAQKLAMYFMQKTCLETHISYCKIFGKYEYPATIFT